MAELDSVRADWQRRGVRWAEAILIRAQHSAPLPPGARLLVNEAGEMRGAISMGCVENDLREHLLALLAGGEPRVIHYGAADLMTLEVGLTCGGEIDVLLRLDSDEPADCATGLRLTRVSPEPVGLQMVRLPGGRHIGSLGDSTLDRLVVEAAQAQCPPGGCALLTVGEVRVFAEQPDVPPTLAIVGATTIAESLCRMAALAGFRVVVVDPRRQYASAARFPDAARVVHAWPDEGLRQAGLAADWYIAVLAHDPKLDLPALGAALRAGSRYIGLLGSRRTQEKYRIQLAEQGFGAPATARIRGPIGLPIGALQPAEIAVSILSELVAARRGKLGDHPPASPPIAPS